MYHRHFSDYIPQKKNPRYSIEYQGFFISRGDWIRTSDHTPRRRDENRRTRILRLHGTPHRELQTDDAAERIQRFVPDDLPGDGYQRPGRCIETVSGKHGVEPVLRTVPAFRCALMRRSCTARLGNPPEHAPEKPAFSMRAFSVQAGGITETGRFRDGSADSGTAPCASRWKPGNSGSRPSRPCRAQRPAAAGSC